MKIYDKQLLELLSKGDYKTFEIIFKSYYPLLCRYANSIVRDAATAEDLVSDVMARFWEKSAELKIKTSLRSYLLRSVYNTSLNYITRYRSRYSEIDGETFKKLASLWPEPDSVMPEDRIMEEELREKLQSVIQELPIECGKIFVMSRIDALSHKEIAERLNISENTVKVQIYRALTKIKKALKDYL